MGRARKSLRRHRHGADEDEFDPLAHEGGQGVRRSVGAGVVGELAERPGRGFDHRDVGVVQEPDEEVDG